MSDPMEIAGALSEEECAALGHVARGATGHALEVGHYLGRSTAVLLMALPPEVPLVTIDWHEGDGWCPGTDPRVFEDNVAPFLGDRGFTFINRDMLGDDALVTLWGCNPPFSFVFYDADHSALAVAAWWDMYRHLLAESCTLVYDDADWDDQAILGELARADGFRSIRSRDWYRGPEDKRDPETFTLEVMRRDA